MVDPIVVEGSKALGDPVRWAIVQEFSAGTRCARALSDVAAVSRPLLSHHLRVLRKAHTPDRHHAGIADVDRADR